MSENEEPKWPPEKWPDDAFVDVKDPSNRALLLVADTFLKGFREAVNIALHAVATDGADGRVTIPDACFPYLDDYKAVAQLLQGVICDKNRSRAKEIAAATLEKRAYCAGNVASEDFAVYRWERKFGRRSGTLSGVFVEDKERMQHAINTKVDLYFYDMLGKHSEYVVPLEESQVKMISDERHVIDLVSREGLAHGVNPLDYVRRWECDCGNHFDPDEGDSVYNHFDEDDAKSRCPDCEGKFPPDNLPTVTPPEDDD